MACRTAARTPSWKSPKRSQVTAVSNVSATRPSRTVASRADHRAALCACGRPDWHGFGLAYGLVVGLVGAIAAGLSGGLRDEGATPNEEIRRSAQYPLAARLIGGLVSGLVFGPYAGIGAGLGFALVFAVGFGGDAYLQHYLVQAWLIGERDAPWRYRRFLEAMAR